MMMHKKSNISTDKNTEDIIIKYLPENHVFISFSLLRKKIYIGDGMDLSKNVLLQYIRIMREKELVYWVYGEKDEVMVTKFDCYFK